jgi:hypothetical protein
MTATLFDLVGIGLGVADRAGAAAALLPPDLFSLTAGINVSDDRLPIVNSLNAGTSFTNVRPGVDSSFGAIGQIGLIADMAVVGAPATTQPFYVRALPNVGILLKPTDPLHPARLFCTFDSRGTEVIVDRLPVKLLLKAGLASSLQSGPVSVGSFSGTDIDSMAYTLFDESQPAEIECFIRLQVTPEKDVILEPTVPLSLGPVRWMGLPAKAVYDIQLLPSPQRRDYLEWTHNDPGSFISDPPVKGAIGFRSIDFDFTKPPLSDLKNRLQNGSVHTDNLELVMEDVVVPLAVPMLPIPSHGTFGFRRKITDPSDINQAYSFTAAPVQIPLYNSGQQGGSGGTSLTLEIDNFFFRTGDLDAFDPADQPQVQFKTALIYQTQSGAKLGPTLAIDDEWTLSAGIAVDPATTPAKFTIADTTVGLVGLTFGVSLSRLGKGMQFKDSFELLGDLFVQGKPPDTGGFSSIFRITSLTGKPLSVVLRGIGYKLGNLSIEALQFPDGMQLIFANVVHVIIEELGWVEEPNGTPYFSFSGGVLIGAGGGQSVQPSGTASDNSGNGFGIRVRRLRFRLNDDATQPPLKIDGVFLKLKYGPVDIEGFGYISDFTDSGWAVKEWGFGAKVALDALAMKFSLSAMFVKGNRRLIADASQSFGYFLAALELGFLPAGPIGLYDIRVLVADNMAPNLDSTFPDGEGMALLKWHQNHDNALSMPANRTLADWIAEKDALAFGVGCGFSLNGCGSALHLDIFIFFAKSAADTGLLIVGELYLLKNPKPIAFVAIEYDISTDKFGIMVGVDLTIGDFASGNLPSWIANIARLSGTMYLGNKPWSFAIGQLADQSSWLALRIDFDVWITVKFVLGVGLQIVDGGPKGFGVVVTLSAGSDWGIGRFVLWGTFGLIIGTWKTGSDTSGLEFWIGVGFKINLFFIFSFGAEINLKITYLGKHPWYITLHAEIKIDTPWFLPDVTFTIDKTYQEALPFDTASVTQGLSKAEGVDPTAQAAILLLAPGLAGALGDAGFLYTFNQLNGLQGQRIADPHLRDDIPIVSVDATIAVTLNQPVANDTMVATTTYEGGADAGLQQVQHLSVRYGLVSIGVRRAPRFGPTAGVWSDLLAPDATVFSIGGTAPQSITFAWDTDTRADGKLAPKRLLVNSAAPYSFATQAAQNDEEAVRNDADYPCCDGRDQRKLFPRPHVLEFGALPFGIRVPRGERFSNDGAWWNWALPVLPAVVPGDPVYVGGHTARVTPRVSLIVGTAELPDPASAAQLELAWDSLPGTLVFEGFSGVDLVATQKVPLTAAGSTSLTLQIGNSAVKGISRIVVRVEIDPKFSGKQPSIAAVRATAMPLPDVVAPALSGHDAPASGAAPHPGKAAAAFPRVAAAAAGWSPQAALRIFRISYITLKDLLIYIAATQRCRNGGDVGPPGSDASGKLAFLPNHDYEIALTTSVQVATKDQGPRELKLTEALYFRTKGLPGLNACANVGDDIRRHVAATYPLRRAILLYRQEPCVLAFENSLSSILPIDRVPPPGSPPEKAQMFPLELNVDRVASLDGMKRLTVPSDDWIAAHRANPYPPRYYPALPLFAKSMVRRAPSTDPLVLRLEAVRLASPQCGPPKLDHASQVLLHEPIDATGGATLWEPSTGYRATVRQQGCPFTERSGFDLFDLGAFVRQADGVAAAVLWSLDGGSLVAPSAGGGRHYASCGELDWDHLQVHSRIDLRAATAAGLAVGVGGGAPVPQAIIATVESIGPGHDLVLRARDATGERELGRKAVAISGPFLLHVTAFDDVVRAALGEVVVEGARGAIREGRVALVAAGAAAFAGIAVSALDIYSFEFVTSAFPSFSAHMGSYDGTLGALAAGSLGGTPVSAAAAFATVSPALPTVMQASADPQQRQALFDRLIAALCIGLRRAPLAVTLDRLTNATGTFALLLQSPEPISLTRDVTVSATRHVRKWVPGPVMPATGLVAPPQPALTIHAVHAAALASGTEAGTAAQSDPAILAGVTFTFRGARMPRGAGLAPGERIFRVLDGPASEVEIYAAAEGNRVRLVEKVPQTQLAMRPDLAAVAKLPAGSIGILGPGGIVGLGHWVEMDVPVPLVALTNGAETAALLMSPGAATLPSGHYKLQFTLDRDRWLANVPGDPEQHYHDSSTLSLSW